MPQLLYDLDRIAVCEVYYLIEADWNIGGLVSERPLNDHRRERLESIGVQLDRMDFHPRQTLSYDTLDEEQQMYYDDLVEQWGLNAPSEDPCAK